MKRKVFSVLLTGIVMVLCLFALSSNVQAEVYSGTWGECTWSLDTQSGTLTLSGGAVEDFSSASQTPWYTYRDQVKKLVAESGVTKIGSYAFCNAGNLTEVTLSEGLTVIGEKAFYGCTALEKLVLPDGVTTVGAYGFYGCKTLESVTLPKTLKSVGTSGFADCQSLTGVYISDLAAWCEINFESNPLYYAHKLYLGGELVTDLQIPEGVTAVGNLAFRGGSCFTSISIPKSVTEIGDWAFEGCSAVTQIQIPEGVTKLGNYAFGSCTKLTSVTLPDSLQSVNSAAFWNCANLHHVLYQGTKAQWEETVSNTVTELSDAFWHYEATGTEVTFAESCTVTRFDCAVCGGAVATLPKETAAHSFTDGNCTACGVSHMWSYTISCDGYATITAYSGTNAELVIPGTIEGAWVRIGDEVFRDHTELTHITISEGVTHIGAFAFSGCGASTIDLPETLTDIGDYAFYACGNLSEITVPFGVQTIGQQTFAACDSLTEAVLQGVTTIGNHAFYHCDTLVSVTLPGSLTTLGDYVFYGCPIPELTIPASVTSLGSFSLFARTIIFQGNAPTVGSAPLCGSNSTVYYPAGNATWTVTAMKRFGSNLTWIADNGVVEEKYIDSGACGENLTWKLHINGILTISGSGTMDTTCPWKSSSQYVRTVVIEEGVTAVANRAFEGCEYMTQITMADSVASIGNYAFHQCEKLTEVTIPKAVTSIGEYGFRSCTALKSITFCGAAPTIGTGAFYGVTATARCPESWTDTQMQSYGGTLTWETTAIPTLTPKYPSLSFEDEVYIKVYFIAENTEDVTEIGLLISDTAAMEQTATKVGYTYDTASGLYCVRTNGIPAKALGQTVHFKIYAKLTDGSCVYSGIYNYSALAYAQDRLANSSNENLKKLCVAMLNYGAAAQTYMNYNVDAPANAALTADQLAMVEPYNASMVAPLTAVDESKVGIFTYSGFSKRYPSISFEGAFGISYYFTPTYTPANGMKLYYWDKETYDSVAVLTIENATGILDMSDSYKATVGGIAAKDIDETIFVSGVYRSDGRTCTTGVLPYSLGAYCVDRATNGSEAMKPLAEATAVYGYYAKQYFAN